MGKNIVKTVRSHSQERKWLLTLGKGNIVEGVRSLMKHNQRGVPQSNGSLKKKENSLKK